MRKSLKILFPLISVIIVIITFYMIFDIKNKVEDINYGTNNIVVNEVIESDVKNTIDEENTVLNDDITNIVRIKPSSNIEGERYVIVLKRKEISTS